MADKLLKIRAVFNYHSSLWPNAREGDVKTVTPPILEQLRADKPNGFEIIAQEAHDDALGTYDHGQADGVNQDNDRRHAAEDEGREEGEGAKEIVPAPKARLQQKKKEGKG